MLSVIVTKEVNNHPFQICRFTKHLDGKKKIHIQAIGSV